MPSLPPDVWDLIPGDRLKHGDTGWGCGTSSTAGPAFDRALARYSPTTGPTISVNYDLSSYVGYNDWWFIVKKR